MQAAILPISAGWNWIRDGFQLLRRQPGPLLFWSMFTGLLITLSYLIPLVGQVVLITAMPLLTFVILHACRQVDAGRPLNWSLWTAPLRNLEVRRRLLGLGLAYLACCMTAGLIATVPFLGELSAAVGDGGELDERALVMALRGPFLVFGLLYLLISAMFWHAPALIGWHKLPTTQALFFSTVACWRNKLPFLAYGASWIALFMGLQLFGSLLASLGLPPTFVQLLMLPLNLALAAALYCSFYPAYVSVFGGYALAESPAEDR